MIVVFNKKYDIIRSPISIGYENQIIIGYRMWCIPGGKQAQKEAFQGFQ